MAKDIKLLIGGSVDRAEKAMRELQRTGSDVAHRLERDFSQLGTSSSLAFDQKRQAATSAYERIKQSGIATGDELKRAEKALGLELARLDEDQYGKRLSLAQKFRNNWVKIAAVAGAIAAGGVAAYSLGKKAVNEYQEFETSLTDLGKVTGENLDAVKEKIMALPPELGSATEMVQGYYQTISAGVTDPKEAMDLLTTAAKASKAAHIDQSTTISALTKLMAGFSGEIKSATEASDLLFAMEKSGQTTFAELAPIIGNIASVSHQAGVSSKEMAAMLAEITKTAGSTSQAATQYSAILRGLIKPTGEMEKALESLGYKSGKAAVENEGLAGVLQLLAGYAEDSGIGMGKLFESSEALTGLGPQLANEFSGYIESLKNMEAAAGGTDKAFDAWKGTFAAVKDAFDNSLGKALISLGEELVPEVIKAMQGVTNWIETNRGTIIEFAQTIGKTLAWVGEQIASLMSQMNTTSQWYQAWKNDQISTLEWIFTSNDSAAARLQEINYSPSSTTSITDRTDGKLFPDLSYATGTSYVPRTGIYQLHRGEEVRTRGDVTRDSKQATPNVAFGDLNISLPNVTNQSSARDLARDIYPEIINLMRTRLRTA